MTDPNDKLTPSLARLRALADELDAEGRPDLAATARRAADEIADEADPAGPSAQNGFETDPPQDR